MNKKFISLIISVMMIIISTSKYSFANENGKVIFISMNRMNFYEFSQIPVLKEQMENRGYKALMNIRGDGGTDDKRSLATMGAGRRANVSSQGNLNFQNSNETNDKIYEALTNQKPKEINNSNINLSIRKNETDGEYGATLGSLGQTLFENNKSVAVLGNSDKIVDEKIYPVRDICLVAMDNYGRIEDGNVCDINVTDYSMPFSIRTDYKKLIDETKKYYNEKDVLFVDLGDTYRLDEYKEYLNESSYEKMKNKIYSNINFYLDEVFKMISPNDVVYVVSPFPSKLDYKERKRISPVVKFDGEGSGLLYSSTTRREGIVANLDIGVDILNEFNLTDENMVGRSFDYVDSSEELSFLDYELTKMATISKNRATLVNTFVGIVSISSVLGAILILSRKLIKNKNALNVVSITLKEFIKLGFIMPLALLVAPVFNFNNAFGISFSIIGVTVFFYVLAKMLFKEDDVYQMGFLATLMILVIVVDSIFGTHLMKNNIMSYDAIVGARYYGIGNEYEGVTIGSAVFAMSVLLNYKKIPKWLVVVSSIIILITSAFPSMGANVGGAISESVAYLIFILLIFDVKLDFKKLVLVGFGAVMVVFVFAFLDIALGTKSHLSVFVNQILNEGPSAIIQTFTRKIQMNIKLAQTSVWVNILIAGILIIAMFIFKPTGQFKKIKEKYPVIFKGFIASMIGCIVTLLVNDSGIVAASTASIYILIPLIIISMNLMQKNEI